MKKIGVLLLLAFALRLAGILCFGRGLALFGNAVRYDNIAMNLVNGRGFTCVNQPDAVSPPLFVFFLAAIFALFGHSLLTAQVFQAVIASISIFLIYSLIRQEADQAPALIAAFIYAVYPVTLFWDLTLDNNTLSTLLNILFILLLIKAERRGRFYFYFLCGLVFGLSILTRPAIIGFPLFYPLALFIFCRKAGEWRKFLKRWAVFCLTAYLLISPWTLRNAIVFKRFIPVTGFSAGHNFYLASLNYQRARYKQAEEYKKILPFYSRYDDWKTAQMPDMLAAEKKFFSAGVKNIRAHPFLFFSSGLTFGILSSTGVNDGFTFWLMRKGANRLLRQLNPAQKIIRIPARCLIFTVKCLWPLWNILLLGLGLAGFYLLRRNAAFLRIIFFLAYALFLHAFFSAACFRYFLPFYPLFLAVGVIGFWQFLGRKQFIEGGE